MKKTLVLIALAFLMCQCGNQQPQQKEEAPVKSNKEAYPEKFTSAYITERAQKLIDFVPDHEFDPASAPAFSKEYFSLLEEAWTFPTDDLLGIGSDEWLYYFLTGNGDCDCASHPKTVKSLAVMNESVAKVKMNYIHNDHDMTLVFVDGDWVIDDFDGTKAELEEYNQQQRKYFSDIDLDEYFDKVSFEVNGFMPEEEQAEMFDSYREQVETYFKKYPK